MCYPAVLTHGNGQSPHLQTFFPFKHLRFVMSISRGMENHPTYGITMDNLTHQGLAITGDTMQQKPLINRGFMVLQSKKPTSKNHGTDWTRASQPSLVVRASLEHLWVDWLVAVSIWSSQSSHSPESDAKSLGIDDQHHVE